MSVITLPGSLRYQSDAPRSWVAIRFGVQSPNEHWFPSLLHARTEIETWRREYNEERPKRASGGLTPADYAKQLK